jgi:hypothetical protein
MTHDPDCRNPMHACRPPRRGPARRGVAVLIVFLLLAMTLGLSYSAIRSQSVSATIQRNGERRASARQMAITGMTMALGKMQQTSWGGIASVVTGKFTDYETFRVTFATGDPRLTAGSTDDGDYPFRVTLLSTGYAADPDNPQCVATHRVRAVVQLVPRALSAAPSYWSSMTGSTVYQWNTGEFELSPPCRIEGRVRLQGSLNLGRNMLWDSDVRQGYYNDLNLWRQAGGSDWRPLNDRVSFYYWWQNSDMLYVLNALLGIPTSNVPSVVPPYPSVATSTLRYTLYPGGRSYDVPTLGITQQDVSHVPNPRENPLGILYRSSKIDVRDDVSVHGTLLTERSSNGDLFFYGKRIQLRPVDLPPLFGTSEPVQLPVVVCGDDFQVHTDAEVSIKGMVMCYDDFEVVSDNHRDIDLELEGKLVVANLLIRPRNDWNSSETVWGNRWNTFHLQKSMPAGIAYFPQWLEKINLSSRPRIKFKPAETEARYHWPSLSAPIYVPAAGDAGLRWDLLDWTENP